MPGPGPLSQDSVSRHQGPPAESTGLHGSMATAPPQPVSHDRDEGERHEQEERPLPPEPCEERLDLFTEYVTEDHPQRRVRQRADQVVQDEAMIRDVSGPAEDRREQSDARRIAAEKDGGRPEAAEVLQRVFDTQVRAQGESA